VGNGAWSPIDQELLIGGKRRMVKDYYGTLSMGKELAMVSRPLHVTAANRSAEPLHVTAMNRGADPASGDEEGNEEGLTRKQARLTHPPARLGQTAVRRGAISDHPQLDRAERARSRLPQTTLVLGGSKLGPARSRLTVRRNRGRRLSW
jgi:hypothetical protein